MNKKREKKLHGIIDRLKEDLSQISDMYISEIQEVLDEEQEYFDTMPANLQEGERGERAKEFIDTMETLVGELEELYDTLSVDFLRGE